MAQIVRPSFAARAAAAAGGIVLAAACAAPAVAPAVAEAAEKASGQFAPSKPPSAQYGPDASRKCQMTPIFRYALDELAAAAKRAGRAAPEADGQVCAVAEAFLAWDPGSMGNPRPQVVTFVSHWFGLPSSVQLPTVATFDTTDEREIADRIVKSSAGAAVVNAVRPRMGIAVQQQRKGRDKLQRISIVVYDALLDVDPLPRRLEPGQKAKLSGRLAGGAKNPKVYVSDASAKLATPEQPAGEGFQGEIACGDRPGRIYVEIRGEFEGASGLAANFPVACAQELPGSIAVTGETWQADAAGATGAGELAEKKMLDALNAERQAVGAPPVKWDDALARVARGISEDLAARGGAPGGPDLVQRLKTEGIASPLVLQSAAADRTFERAHERILTSPRDRATVLEPEANQVGIGAVARKDAEGRPIVYVTELLVKELPPLDLASVRQQLRDAVAQKRKDARTNAVTPDATLDEVAQTFAEALSAAGGTLAKEKATELTAPLNKSFKSVTMISGAKQEPLDFAEEPQATAPGKALGVGISQGRHPVLGRNAVYVVLMVGTARPSTDGAPAGAKKKPTAAKTKK
jgi:uncharacterized protein YkwD